jgi:hypothetical protein
MAHHQYIVGQVLKEIPLGLSFKLTSSLVKEVGTRRDIMYAISRTSIY